MSGEDLDILEVLNAEEMRCKSIEQRDFKTLDSLLASEYVFIHANGRLDDKSAFMAARETGPAYVTEIKDLHVAIHGSIALVSGTQVLLLPVPGPLEVRVSQAWIKEGTWRQAMSQYTRVLPPAGA